MQLNDTKVTVAERTKTKNYEGGEAFDPDSPQLALYRRTINNMLEDTYYEEDEKQFKELVKAFEECVKEDPEFPLQLAVYSREEAGLRDVSQVLLILSSNNNNSKQFVREYGSKIVQRPDDMTTGLALQLEYFGSSLPNPLQNVYEESFNSWDEYQFAKYRMSNREVSLVDAMNLVHPKPYDDEHDELFERLVKGELDDYPEVEALRQHGTWEDTRSEDNDERSEKEQWLDSLERMGILAKLRNVRNMLQAGIEGEQIFDGSDLEYLKNSKTWPWRVYQAYKAIKDEGLQDSFVERWFEKAIDATVNTLDLTGRTLVATDVSGSMSNYNVSNKSEMSCAELSCFFSAVLNNTPNTTVGVFADDWQVVNSHVDAPTLTVMDQLQSVNVGSSTNGHLSLEWALQEREEFDRVVVLTDEQMWDSTTVFGRSTTFKEKFDQYTNEYGGTSAYIINLNSYSEMVTPEGYNGVYRINGWHSNILDFVQYAEKEDQAIQDVRDFAKEGVLNEEI